MIGLRTRWGARWSVCAAPALLSCGGGSGGSGAPAPTRAFMMGSTPFFTGGYATWKQFRDMAYSP
jgi:hypothetical protein